VGSRETRKFLERRRPLLGLHGHIHESPAVSGRFADRLGPTICVNAGQRMGSSLHAVWFSLDDVAGSLTHSLMGKAGL
jgi:Icc-related predicted phosphoesterase